MMDGVAANSNENDNATDDWNEHVLEVERASDNILTGEESDLFFSAAGALLNFSFPSHQCFMGFLSWMQKQLATRRILPADSEAYQAQAAVFFQQFVSQLVDSVRTAAEGVTLLSRQIDIQDLVRLQLYAMTRDPVFFPTSSVMISELDDGADSVNATPPLATTPQDSLEMVMFSSPTATVTEDTEVHILSSDPNVHETAMTTLEFGSTAMGTGPSAATSRARGRPRRTATPTIQNQVRYSTRLNNDGRFYALPNLPSRRRASSVPRAATPAVLQISEMQRLGVEECLIDPAELSEERLLQERDSA
jgi:hypothetical protein